MSKQKDMTSWMNYIACAGFNVRMLSNGSLEVQDPYHLNGKANAGYDLVTLSTSSQAAKFVNDRS